MATQRSPRLKDDNDDTPDEPTAQERAAAGDAAPADDPRKTQKAPPEFAPVGAPPDATRAAVDPTIAPVPGEDEIPRFRVTQGFFDGEKLWPKNSEINWHFKYHPSLSFTPMNQSALKLWNAAKAWHLKRQGR